jgi:hypothetical protein
LHGHNDDVNSAAFSRREGIVTASDDNTISIWERRNSSLSQSCFVSGDMMRSGGMGRLRRFTGSAVVMTLERMGLI